MSSVTKCECDTICAAILKNAHILRCPELNIDEGKWITKSTKNMHRWKELLEVWRKKHEEKREIPWDPVFTVSHKFCQLNKD